MKRLRRARPQYAQQGLWFFVQDNARPHAANIVKQFQAKKGVVQIEQIPFLPDLNPRDFFLFPRRDISATQRKKNVTRFLNSISKDSFLQSSEDMINRSQLCIVMGGEYFEG
ncbi:hypothetical protein TNCV_4323781 [Trichonephila clavipes]|nr:hypothetical protein TNCV_4323781 [Trichonephila clavipes]